MRARRIVARCVLVLIAACGRSDQSASPALRHVRVLGRHGVMRFAVADTARVPTDAPFLHAADAICDATAVCFVSFWADESSAARARPMTDA